MRTIPPRPMKTDRLVLRPTRGADADRAFEIQTDWEVTRMLLLASFPPNQEEIRRWFVDHPREWLAGEAYRFAVEIEGTMVGVVDVGGIAEREGSLGYWFDRTAWGRGYAFEAARAVTGFALVDVGLSKLRAAHAHDNPASARVLAKLGFTPLDIVQRFSRSRCENILEHRYVLPSQRP
jgi:[ribosomal protein S5]-alanine N-acetyltransferase